MTSLRKVAGTCTKFWLGGQCESGQKCKWVDGTDFDYTNFLNGNTGTENCVLADTRSVDFTTERRSQNRFPPASANLLTDTTFFQKSSS
uniref:C-type lectin domain-containing protein n=1 Tax=Caenorhabditis japonica TaxID=281687 RepID=A0A8R1IQP7_CAEJA